MMEPATKMKAIPADSSNDRVMTDGNPKIDDSNNVGVLSDVILIISKFIIQVLTVPKTNPNTAIFLFLVNIYADIATMNPAIIEGIMKGMINKLKTAGRIAMNIGVLKSSEIFELSIVMVLEFGDIYLMSEEDSTLMSYLPFGSFKEYSP